MTVKELINELQKVPEDWPICIDDHMGFIEANEQVIKVEKKVYICFPYTDSDEFQYVNLKTQDFD
jgi:hypothetical protein